MQAVILTAGEGSRMRPLSLTRPKTMLPVGGKPIIQYNIEYLQNVGIKDILLITGYKEEIVKNYFKNIEFEDNIQYITQEKQLGTAHAIGHAKNFVKEEFIVLNGDIIIDPELLEDLIYEYESNSAKTMMVLTKVNDPSAFGVVELEGNKIVKIIEKPDPNETSSNLINTGIYIFNKDILSKIEKTELSERDEYEITDSVQMQIDDMMDVQGFITDKKWIDIGRPWDLIEINEEFINKMDRDIKGIIEENVHIEGNIILGKNSVIKAGTYIKGPVYIGEDCSIGPNAYLRGSSCLCDNVSVGNAVEIKNSIIMENTNVNHLTYVGDSVIGANCNLGAGTNLANLRFDDNEVKMTIKEKKVSTKRRKFGSVFADGVKTGVNTSFNPGVTVGVDSTIGSGAVIYKDIKSHKNVITNQDYESRDK